MRPRIGFATRRLLERAGRQVMVPLTQTCCGQPGYNSGDRQSAKALALKVMHEFENCVVAPSGSCAGMIREHYPELFSDSPQRQEEIKRLVQRSYEPTDFLANVAKLESISDPFNGTVYVSRLLFGFARTRSQGSAAACLQKFRGHKHRREAAPARRQ
jgi:L-lactate dehydrogenase complex protein LldE